MLKLSKYPPRGFTLIELLVVVLIIGILAAIAIPQYRRTVEKSRASEVITLINAISKSIDSYYLVNNDYPKKFADLDIDLSWTGKVPFYTGNMSDFISNDKWSIGIEGNNSCCYSILAIRLSGYYKGGGFILAKKQSAGFEHLYPLSCAEWLTGDIVFEQEAGEYCFNIMGSQEIMQDSEWARFYRL